MQSDQTHSGELPFFQNQSALLFDCPKSADVTQLLRHLPLRGHVEACYTAAVNVAAAVCAYSSTVKEAEVTPSRVSTDQGLPSIRKRQTTDGAPLSAVHPVLPSWGPCGLVRPSASAMLGVGLPCGLTPTVFPFGRTSSSFAKTLDILPALIGVGAGLGSENDVEPAPDRCLSPVFPSRPVF
ncbi:hypothetical protein CPLU01_11334 [Colletotrichum plurivorum]|uniref:Uncharacterized protein n=1 Tax=Colletotrichum plurivorum TaxID=2175906 RepID=A0A8H6K3C4_9PEZI|nr:hypothetical protein CPLU01_11334 [Colletotrichum plurivorum]